MVEWESTQVIHIYIKKTKPFSSFPIVLLYDIQCHESNHVLRRYHNKITTSNRPLTSTIKSLKTGFVLIRTDHCFKLLIMYLFIMILVGISTSSELHAIRYLYIVFNKHDTSPTVRVRYFVWLHIFSTNCKMNPFRFVFHF